MRVKASVFLFWFTLCMSFSGLSLADEKIHYILPYPTANELYDAWSPDGVIYYFAGDAGTILKYDGASFTIMETPTDYPLFCIHGTSKNDIWAAGGNDYSENQMDRAVYLHYDGQSWTEVPPPVYMDTATYPPEGIFAVAPDNVWAVDAFSPSLFHYDGTSWAVVLLNIPGFTLAGGFDAIHAFAADDIYAVGSYGQIIHYDGTGWSLQLQKDDPTSYTSFNLFTDVWGPDPDHVFACANWGQVYGLNQQTGGWEQLADGLSGVTGGLTLTSISGRVDPVTTDPDICFSSYTGAMYHYNGTVFTEIPPSDSWKQNVIRRNGAGSYIVAGGMGRMETFNGQWSPISRIPINKNSFEHITWADDNLWFAPAAVDERAGVFAWNRGQMTEYKLPLGGQQGVMTGLKALAENDVWAGVQPRGGVDFGIFRFDGTSWAAWKPTNTPYPLPFSDVLRTAGGELFIILVGVTDGGPGRIVDGQAVGPYPDTSVNMYSSLAEGSDGKVYAAGQNGRIASFSSGEWAHETSGTDKNFTGIAAGNGYVYAVAADRTAVYKTDGGQWQAVGNISGIAAGNDFTGVVHMEGDQFIATLNTPEGYIGGNKGEVYLFSQGQAQRLSGWISPTLQGITRTDTGQFFITGSGGVLLSSRGVMQGDVDMSMSVDLRDVLLSLGVQTGEMSAPERADWAISATDIGNDNKVTMQDTLFILQSLAGQRAVENP